MCYVGILEKEKIKRVATVDIPVYKIVKKMDSGEFKSYWFLFNYEPGQEYKTEIRGEYGLGNEKLIIEGGFHSYGAEQTKIYVTKTCDWRMRDMYVIERQDGEAVEVYYPYNTYKLNCIIPSGAMYYNNNDGEFVSDRIKVLSAEPIK